MPRLKSPVHILITAGHAATTALATIQKLQADKEVEWKISWVGPRQAFSSNTAMKPFELDLFPQLGVSVYPIDAGKLQSKFTRHTIPGLLKLPVGFIQAFYLILKLRPRVVLSFGGFAAFPVVFAAWLTRCPVILHEQTVAVGLSNKVSSWFSKKVTLARQESEQFFESNKTVLVGNPLMHQVEQVRRSDVLPHTPVIYITGGSRGAQRINNVIFQAVPKLLPSYRIIHQTGQLDFEKGMSLKRSLSTASQKKYEVHAFINPIEVGHIYEEASILIGRAGANTVSEVMALSIPSIFIPIPWTRMDEQTQNARFAEKNGIADVLLEKDLTVTELINRVELLMKNWKKMVALGKKSSHIDRTAATALIKVVTSVLS